MSKKYSATIVSPTIREDRIKEFLTLWENEFKGHRVIIVEDNPEKTFSLPSWVEHYSWRDIDKELGKNSWIIPRKSDTIRSYGYFKASQKKTDFIVTLDDDCYPEEKYDGGFLESIKRNLDRKWEEDKWWWSTLDEGIFPRGYPYKVRGKYRRTVLHHGLWSNIPDLDAKTQYKKPDFRTKPARHVQLVPTGKFFPMCGMNVAFRPEIIPAFYFLLMGQDKNGNFWKFDRFGDIWSGIFLKKITDHLGLAVSSGSPSIHHSKASNVEVNLRKEKPGYPINEILWQKVDDISLKSDSFIDCYREIAGKLNMKGEYWDKLKKAMKIWAGLYS